MVSTIAVTDHTARTHNYNLFKSLMDSLTDLAQSRLFGIINNRRRLVAALPGSDRRHRAHSAAGPPHHRIHETRVPESVDTDPSHECRISTGTTHSRKRTLDTAGIVSRHRAHSAAALAPTQAVTQEKTSTHTHRTRTTRVQESTAIIKMLLAPDKRHI